MSPILVHISLASLSEAEQEHAQHLGELANDEENILFLIRALIETTTDVGKPLPPNGSLVVVTGPESAFSKQYANCHPVGDQIFAIGFFKQKNEDQWTMKLFEADDGSSLPPDDLYAGPGTPFAVDAWLPLAAGLARLDQQADSDKRIRSWYHLPYVRVDLSALPNLTITNPNAKDGEQVGSFVDTHTGKTWRVVNEGETPFSFEAHAETEYFATQHLCTIDGDRLLVSA